MRCDEVLTRAADLAERGDADVERHVATCTVCREEIDAARAGRDLLAEFETAESTRTIAAADAAGAWRSRRRLRPVRIARVAVRAAVVVLAVTGTLALAGVDVRGRAPSLTRADIDAAVDAALGRFSARLDERDRVRAEETGDATEWLDERRRNDVGALVGEMSALRRELAAVRMVQRSMVGAAMPALPDPR